MANDPTILGPQLVKINKKTGANSFTLYHPQTGAAMVLYDGSLGLPWTAATKPSYAHKYTEQGVLDDTSGTYYLVSDILRYTNAAIDDFGGVLEFKDISTPSALHDMADLSKGEVWIVYNDDTSAKSIYWADQYSSSASSVTWQQFPNNTLFVYTGDNSKAISDTNTGTGTNVTTGWVPLGGNNDIYATKSEAIHSIVGSSDGLKFGYASESGATHSVANVGTIGTTTVNTLGIVSTIPTTGADNSIPNVAAVRAFAGSADNVIVKTTDTSKDYYITFVENTGTTGQSLYVDTGITYNPHTNELNVTASTANLAKAVDKALTAFGQSYNGSAAVTIAAGSGLAVTTNASGTVVGVAVAGAVTLNDNDEIDLDEIHTTGANAVYSAVQVDKYGRATAGAQSIIFAAGPNDPDLNDLVVGGLAFIGTSTTAAGSYAGSANAMGTVGTMDDAE